MHIVTLLAALAASIGQGIDAVRRSFDEEQIWEYLTHTALRIYGVLFALGVVLAELSE